MTVALYDDEARVAVHNGLGLVHKGYVLIPDDDPTGQGWLAAVVSRLAVSHGADLLLLDELMPTGADRCSGCGEKKFRVPEAGTDAVVAVEREPFPVEVLAQAQERDHGEVRFFMGDPKQGCMDCGSRRRYRLLMILCDLVEERGKFFVGILCERCFGRERGFCCPLCQGPLEELSQEAHPIMPFADGMVDWLVEKLQEQVQAMGGRPVCKG